LEPSNSAGTVFSGMSGLSLSQKFKLQKELHDHLIHGRYESAFDTLETIHKLGDGQFSHGGLFSVLFFRCLELSLTFPILANKQLSAMEGVFKQNALFGNDYSKLILGERLLASEHDVCVHLGIRVLRSVAGQLRRTLLLNVLVKRMPRLSDALLIQTFDQLLQYETHDVSLAFSHEILHAVHAVARHVQNYRLLHAYSALLACVCTE
jgi:hypothetical protein